MGARLRDSRGRGSCAALCFVLGACATPPDPTIVGEWGERTAELLASELDHRGRDPIDFVIERLDAVDLVLFDDGLHSAVEPYEFYARLVRDPRFARRCDVLFLETVALDQQEHLEAFLESPDGDPSLLLPALRDDVSGLGGIGYRTFHELLEAVRVANRARPAEERLRVVAVSNATHWETIRTRDDVRAFQASLADRDREMYQRILEGLDGFRSGAKGVFLTNTRHAYTGIRDARGELHWNTGTYFRENHPGKTCSVRLHNATLALEEAIDDPDAPRTAEGLERVRYRWARVDDGGWDAAFAARGNLPVAIELAGTAFGRAPYLGNHMLDAAPGQTMADAYDALVFLAPLERLRQSATMPGLYGPEFLPELARRYALQRTDEELVAELAAAGAQSVDELVASAFVEAPERPVPAVE